MKIEDVLPPRNGFQIVSRRIETHKHESIKTFKEVPVYRVKYVGSTNKY